MNYFVPACDKPKFDDERRVSTSAGVDSDAAASAVMEEASESDLQVRFL
jgi:hypothetical protein